VYRLSDFEDHYKLCADPDVMRDLLGYGHYEVGMPALIHGIERPKK